MSSTINYYNCHAQEFYDITKDIVFTEIQDRFLSELPPKASVLDFGCGSGRDTKYFLNQGFIVDAIDGSEELCNLASEYTGLSVKHMYFEELNEHEKYDGIWACSSILHLDMEGLINVLKKMNEALKIGGIVYTSFKYGTFSGERNGRYFTDMTEKTAHDLFNSIDGLKIKDQWISSDVRPGREEERWLNLILRRIR